MRNPKPLLNSLKFILPVFLLWACTADEPLIIDSPVENPEITTDTPELTYLALGDSYTIGSGVAEEERFPIQLANRLAQDSLNVQTPEFIAQQGWTTDRLAAAIIDKNIKDTFDLVSLLIGVNNQYQGKPIGNYEGEFLDLLQSAITFAGGRTDRVIVLSIPDYSFTPFGQNRPNPDLVREEIDAYNAINKRVSDDLGVTYFDITPISRRGLTDEELVAVDDLHPSGKMYAEWVDLMIDSVKELLHN